MGSAFRNLRHAIRSLMGDRGFTVTVVLTIAVCIAANTATFAVVNSVLLRPLPVPDAGSILLMANRYPKAGADSGYNSATGDYYDRLRDVQVFSEQALFRTSGRTLDIQGTPERMTGMLATPSLFRLLRVSPAYGRAFSDAEGEPGADQKTILSDGLSRRLFGSPQAALGRDVRMSGQPFTVVGVMPAGFNFIDPEVRLWTPAAFTAQEREVRHSNNWHNIGRLKAGREPAAGPVPGGRAQPRQPRPVSKLQGTADQRGFPHHGFAAGGHAGEGGPGSALPALGRSGFCAADRRFECREPGAGANHAAAQGVRHAAGAGRRERDGWCGQLVTESILVALAGGAAGAALGAGLLSALAHSGIETLPRAGEVRVDGMVVLAMLATAALVGIVIGLIPSAQVMRAQVNEVLREESRSGTGGRRARRVRQILVVAQVGLAFVLLAGAGLVLASFRQLLHVDPGFDVKGVVTASTSVPQSLYPKDADARTLMDRALDCHPRDSRRNGGRRHHQHSLGRQP